MTAILFISLIVLLIRLPANTKNGIASNVKLPQPENIRWITMAL